MKDGKETCFECAKNQQSARSHKIYINIQYKTTTPHNLHKKDHEQKYKYLIYLIYIIPTKGHIYRFFSVIFTIEMTQISEQVSVQNSRKSNW